MAEVPRDEAIVNLREVSGIGTVYATRLYDAGIRDWRELPERDNAELETILVASEPRVAVIKKAATTMKRAGRQ